MIMPLCFFFFSLPSFFFFFLQRAVNTASARLLGLLPGDQTANGALQGLGKKSDTSAAINLANVVSWAKGWMEEGSEGGVRSIQRREDKVRNTALRIHICAAAQCLVLVLLQKFIVVFFR